eukprot:7489111-Pyramimonas_sp.AAC.1
MLRGPGRPSRSLPDPLALGAVKPRMEALPSSSVTATGARELLRPFPCPCGSAAQLAREHLAHEVGTRTWVHDYTELA